MLCSHNRCGDQYFFELRSNTKNVMLCRLAVVMDLGDERGRGWEMWDGKICVIRLMLLREKVGRVGELL